MSPCVESTDLSPCAVRRGRVRLDCSHLARSRAGLPRPPFRGDATDPITENRYAKFRFSSQVRDCFKSWGRSRVRPAATREHAKVMALAIATFCVGQPDCAEMFTCRP